MKHITAILALIISVQISSTAQSRIVKDFKPACDSLATLMTERTGVCGNILLKTAMKRGGNLDFYFTESLGDYPWRKDDVKWLRNTLKDLFPEEYSRYRLGEIYSRKVSLDRLVMPQLTYDGRPSDSRHKVKAPSQSTLIVENLNGREFTGGLSGRHIALWQSHGRYFDNGSGLWKWQRPCLFQTCEDMFTQGFVLPYLVPMLENAGAYVLLPRERDIQHNEVIVDNDLSCGARGKGTYKENGRWTDAGEGFADIKPIYQDLENPFRNGTARSAACVSASSKPTASVTWTPVIPERGEYAVYVSYKSLPNSTASAHYTVHHLGGRSEFAVNQKMGGGTWIYLGTFEFAEGSQGYVTLDNRTPKGYRMEVGATVSADAVRFGGGMGNIARGREVSEEESAADVAEPEISGLPRSAEGARYYLQWAGADSTAYYQNCGEQDYRDDFMSRGDWVEWITRGSRTNPDRKGGLGIPVDLSFGFHTDAGVRPDESIVGTLGIYTYRSEGKTTLPTGEDRLTSRMYTDMVQSQIVDDIRATYDSLWTRRNIWDRSYRESRTPSCPAMLLELLSHQNFADMKRGLDPSFRFTVSRAIYKGMLKYLSNRFGCGYTVQPLPVSSVGVRFSENGNAVLSWSPVEDPLEPTASPEGYIVYKRIGNGGFDNGTYVTECRYETALTPGEPVSFKVVAYNDGGLGFPSETVSIGIPAECPTADKILIVNNFDRISAPAWFDGEERAGFDNSVDSGVPDRKDITFIGEMYNFRRGDEWITNSRQGFGASYSDMAGSIVAGNSFDYPYEHGKSVLEAGYAFYSCSNERFSSDSLFCSDAWTIDLVCGKQVTTPVGNMEKFTIFPYEMQNALRRASSKGINLIVSGSYIGTDVDDCIYPVQKDSTFHADVVKFAKETLGYSFVTNHASRKGAVRSTFGPERLPLVKEMNPHRYCVESVDGIAPANSAGKIIYRYSDTDIPAGVYHQGNGYRCISLGFPIDAVEDAEMKDRLIVTILEYLKK